MEKVTTENPRRFSRREFLKAAGITAAAAGISQFASSKPQGLEKESVASKVTSLPTVGHDVIFIPSPHQEPTPVVEENIIAEAKPVVVEAKPVVAEAKPLIVEEEKKPPVAPKESSPEYNLLSPEAFAPYAAMGGPETSGEEILDYFPQSYNDAPDSLKGLWGRAVDAKLRDKPQTDESLAIDVATLPEKISFDYRLVPEGTKFFDIQEQEERIMPCGSNVVVIGKIEGEESFLAVYQEPVNSYYYFAKAGEDVLKGQKDLAASKNLIVEAFNPPIKNLSEIGTPEGRKRLYEVKEGDSLTTIAKYFGLPSWHCLYGKNISIDPESLPPGLKMVIPDKYKESDFIKTFTPDPSRVTLDGEFFREGIYFPETEHYVKKPYTEIFQKLGIEILGYPISEATPRNGSQYFQNFIIERGKTDYYSNIPGRPKLDGVDPCFFIHPLGWETYLRQNYPQESNIGNPPAIGEYPLGNIFGKFYEEHGGLEIFGYPVSEQVVYSDGTIEQWLTNSLLRFDPSTNQVEIAPLAQETLSAFFSEQLVLPWFRPAETKERKVFVDDALAIIEASPDKKKQLDQRAVVLTVAWMRNDDEEILAQKRELYRDWQIFKYLAVGQERTFNNARAILAWHDVRFEMNPVVEKALDRLSGGSRLINKFIQEKVPAEVFQDNKYPSLPEDWHGIFVFAGGKNLDLSGGLGFKGAPLLYGAYDQYRGEGSNDEQRVLEALVQNGLHEGIHSFIQPASKIEHSQQWPEERSEDLNFVPADIRKGLLAHMSMCILTSAAQKHYGFEERRDPRIDYILKVLEQEGVDDPEAEVIQAAATFNSHRLWNIYEQVRKENDPSMDSLMSTQDPDLAIIQNIQTKI